MNELPHLPNEEIVRTHLEQDRKNWLFYKAKAERAEGLDSNLNGIQREFMDRIDRSLDKLIILGVADFVGSLAVQSEVEVVEVSE